MPFYSRPFHLLHLERFHRYTSICQPNNKQKYSKSLQSSHQFAVFPALFFSFPLLTRLCVFFMGLFPLFPEDTFKTTLRHIHISFSVHTRNKQLVQFRQQSCLCSITKTLKGNQQKTTQRHVFHFLSQHQSSPPPNQLSWFYITPAFPTALLKGECPIFFHFALFMRASHVVVF